MVVSVAVCVKKGDADIEELPDNQQRGRKAERTARDEGSTVHFRSPEVLGLKDVVGRPDQRTTSKCIIISAACCSMM